MKFSLLTCTGMRHDMFRLCEMWMKRQTTPSVEWIVVDDGEVPTEVSLNQTVIRPTPFWKLGDNTQRRNMISGLQAVTGDVVAIIEDDDYITPNYLAIMLERMDIEKADMIGEAQAFYYHLKESKYKRLRNFTYSTFSQTIFKASLIPVLLDILQNEESKHDFLFWKEASKHSPTYLFPTAKLVIGIKGVPGRPGAGSGHDTDTQGWIKDLHPLAKLQQYIGDDVKYYRGLVK